MIVGCPHCGQKVRVQNEGHYRCPLCREVFEHRAAAEPPEAAAVEAPPPPPAPTEQPPVCERCNYYQASTVCKQCGMIVCTSCAVPTADGQSVCRVHWAEQTAQSPENDLLAMLRGVLFAPAKTFGALLPDSRLLGRAVWFAVVCGTISAAFSVLYSIALPAPFNDPMTAILRQYIPWLPSEAPGVEAFAGLLFVPVAMLIGLFLQALIVHGLFRLVGVGKGALAGTIKVVGYSFASSLLGVVPVVGPFVAGLYSLALLIIGGARVHRTSYGRIAFALLLLVLLGAVLGALSVFAISGIGGAVDAPTGPLV